MKEKIKVAFQGEKGAYSHLACLEIFPDFEPIACATFEEAFQLAKDNSNYKIAWVSKKERPLPNYINCNKGDNIFYKEKYYSELTFHYWFWKNQLKNYDENSWLGFCQYRRYWLKENYDHSIKISRENLKDNILSEIPLSWQDHDNLIRL